MAKKTRLNRKQVDISHKFVYIKYKVQRAMFKSATLNLRQKLIKKTAKNPKRFSSIYVQLSRLQNLEKVSFLEPISIDNINNLPYHEFQIDNERLQKLGDITLLSFTNAAT